MWVNQVPSLHQDFLNHNSKLPSPLEKTLTSPSSSHRVMSCLQSAVPQKQMAPQWSCSSRPAQPVSLRALYRLAPGSENLSAQHKAGWEERKGAIQGMWVSPRLWFSKFLRPAAEAPGNLLKCGFLGPAPDVLIRLFGQGWGPALCMSLSPPGSGHARAEESQGVRFLGTDSLICALWTGHVTCLLRSEALQM